MSQMTLTQMTEALQEKGHTREYSETRAALDFADLNEPDFMFRNMAHDRDCSVCRRTMTEIEYRYHWHPCE